MEDKENKSQSTKSKKSGTASSSFMLFSGTESRPFNFAKTTLSTQSTSAPKPQEKCLCGSVPSKGDIFYYQSKYSKNLVEGIVDHVKDGYIQSKNRTLYRFDEIFIKTKLEIREEKINEILRKND